MDIRNSILAAAETIERNPLLFKFKLVHIPECNTPGCALGWIGHYAGFAPGTRIERYDRIDTPVCALGLRSQVDFYKRMNLLAAGRMSNWCFNAVHCAAVLRRYADEFHPAPAVAAEPAAAASREAADPAATAPALDPAYVRLQDQFAKEFAF